ncbi:MAG: NAD-dependent epimerase/dehydratase family protein [Pyrinomonadaceae bacterium]|nr:NAD-dependent epimerase/dehydratase family protein [Pyrinomonadaceae bacterium]
MKRSRREFLKTLSVTSIALGAGPIYLRSATPIKKKVLVLGGTKFVGPAVVNAALKRDHNVTLFNRGITNPGLLPELPLIKGDREKGIGAYEPLKSMNWDVVIDVWPEKAGLVDDATKALQMNAKHYIFVSSIAVYRDFQEVGLNENSQVVEPRTNRSEWGYAEEKLSSERIVAKRFPKNHTVLRPGPIKGWRDSAKDLYYWLYRLKEDRQILGPGTGKDPLQFIDVNDVGRFAVKSFENKLNGIFNCTGPREKQLVWKEFLSIAKTHLGSDSKIYWPGEEFLKTHKVRSFEDLPLWAPLSEDRGFMQISMRKSVANGFEFTPVEKTIDETIRWVEKTAKSKVPSGGLTKSMESELIKKLERSNVKKTN